MCAKINSNAYAHSLTQTASPQFTEAGTLMNQGNWTSANAQAGNDISLAIPILNTLGGVLGAAYGLHLTRQGVHEISESVQCCDQKGIVTGTVSTGVGVTFTGASTAMCANGVVGFLPKLGLISLKTAHSLIALFTMAMNWLGLSLYSLYIGGAVAALPELHSFRASFQEMLNTSRISPKTKAVESLRFLQEQISVGEQRKWNQFVRCVGLECAQKVASELPQLLEEVQNGKLDRTEALLTEVNCGNFKQIVGQIAMFTAGILGMVGSLLALSAVGGYVVFALFVSASALYWLNGVISDIAYKLFDPSTDMTRVCYKNRYAVV